MKQYDVTGMSCAACSARVEKAVKGVPGVTGCAVSLLTNSMGVEGSASDEAIIRAVTDAGYGASVKGAVKSKEEDVLEDKETPKLQRRLITSALFLIVLMYFSMGHNMFGFPLPAFFENNPLANGIVQMSLAVIVMVINRQFFISGFKALWNKAPNMDSLVALGSAASFGYSWYALLMMSDALVKGNDPHVYMHEFYFEAAAMILTLITIGKMLEARAKGKTTDALKGLMKLAPKTAVLWIDGQEKEVDIEQVKKGDIFVVKPGENIPVDGVIIEGHSAINESSLSGESIPVDKGIGDPVSAATINTSGYLRCEATRVGEDTTLSKIIQMVSDAAATKAPIAKIADQVSGIFVPTVIGIACITFVVWMLLGKDVGLARARATAVRVISCPCSLGLATPVAIMVGNGKGAKQGILFKTAVSLEQAGKSEIVVLDKTGTITSGTPQITDIIPTDVSEKELLEKATMLEKKSEHPLAKAITARGIECGEVEEFEALPGNGLKGTYEGKKLAGGNLKFISSQCDISEEIKETADCLAEEGKTPLFFCEDGKLIGIIAVMDVMKEDSKEAVRQLHGMGVKVVMLTGDNEKTAKAIGNSVGVDEVKAGVLPDGKEAVIRELQKQGMVCMVGDGINDAPALTRADIGMAIGAGTDVAIDAADVVLMKSSLLDVCAAIRLSRATLTNIRQNLFWAFFYNSLGIPLAAGVFIGIFGWKMNPMFGAAAMSLSSFTVVSNALRLNLIDLNDPSKDRKLKKKEKKTITRTMVIEEMMCHHCENAVKKALEAIDGVDSAIVSYTEGTAIVTLSKKVRDEVLKQAVEAEDYPVKQIY